MCAAVSAAAVAGAAAAKKMWLLIAQTLRVYFRFDYTSQRLL